MAHQIEMMMSVKETPWHGLGRVLETPPATVAEALKLAGLDWTVSLQPLYLPDGRLVTLPQAGDGEDGEDENDGKPKCGRFAVVRDSDKSVLGTVGPGFRPVQNARAFKFFDPFIAGGENAAASIDTAGSLRGGARVWMMVKINRPDSVIVKKCDDRVAKYLVLAQGHDGSLSIHVILTPVRVVCQNTLRAAMSTAAGMFKIRHVDNAENMLRDVQTTIQRLDVGFEKSADLFRAMAAKKIRTTAQLRAFVDAVFPPAKKKEEAASAPKVDALALMSDVSRDNAKDEIRDELLENVKEAKSRVFDSITSLFEKGRGNDLPGVKGTLWGAYNAVTEYLTWERGGTADARFNNLMLGGSGAPVRALKAAEEMLDA